MKAIQTVEIDPSLLIVTRDNFLDDAYYEAIYAEKRREALRMVGREAVEHVRAIPNKLVNIAWAIGEGMVEAARR